MLWGGLDDEAPFLREARKRHCPKCPFLIYCRGGVWPVSTEVYFSLIRVGGQWGPAVRCTASTLQQRHRTFFGDLHAVPLNPYEGICLEDMDEDRPTSW